MCAKTGSLVPACCNATFAHALPTFFHALLVQIAFVRSQPTCRIAPRKLRHAGTTSGSKYGTSRLTAGTAQGNGPRAGRTSSMLGRVAGGTFTLQAAASSTMRAARWQRPQRRRCLHSCSRSGALSELAQLVPLVEGGAEAVEEVPTAAVAAAQETRVITTRREVIVAALVEARVALQSRLRPFRSQAPPCHAHSTASRSN